MRGPVRYHNSVEKEIPDIREMPYKWCPLLDVKELDKVLGGGKE